MATTDTTSATSGRGYALHGVRFEADGLAPGLHVVSTPIGNLGDITLRAIATLAAADLVLAEDTRVTRTLLAHYGIATPLTTYHEHNAERRHPEIMTRLDRGEAIALVSDAGTPLISDPGGRLVGEMVGRGTVAIANPGASAVLAALVVAGLPTAPFFFEGFLPPRATARRQRIAALAGVPGTLVFYESPRRVADLLADLAAVLGSRDAAVARELTKFFEAVTRGSLEELAQRFAAAEPPRGEIVVLVAPPDGPTMILDGAPLDARIQTALETLSVKDAASVIASETGQPRRKVYARAVALAAASGR